MSSAAGLCSLARVGGRCSARSPWRLECRLLNAVVQMRPGGGATAGYSKRCRQHPLAASISSGLAASARSGHSVSDAFALLAEDRERHKSKEKED